MRPAPAGPSRPCTKSVVSARSTARRRGSTGSGRAPWRRRPRHRLMLEELGLISVYCALMNPVPCGSNQTAACPHIRGGEREHRRSRRAAVGPSPRRATGRRARPHRRRVLLGHFVDLARGLVELLDPKTLLFAGGVSTLDMTAARLIECTIRSVAGDVCLPAPSLAWLPPFTICPFLCGF